MESPSLSEGVQYVIHNKDIIQTHMAKHRATWQSETPVSREDEGLEETYIRVRPLLERDLVCGAFSLVDVQNPSTLHFTKPLVRAMGGRFSTKSFKATAVFREDTSNDAVFEGMKVAKAVKRCLAFSTRELSILAYGQTGTGKTHSTTALEERVVRQVCAEAESQQHTIYIEAFEIRGNSAFDLLSDPPLAPVKVLATGAGDVQYHGLSKHAVPDLAVLEGLVNRAKELRLTRSTVKNSVSSRSHSVIRLHIHSEDAPEQRSQINVIDLAGSERSNILVQNDIERMKESIETNKSLSSLKDCVRAIVSGDSHIPWRGSKLTMALKNIFNRPRALSDRTDKLLILACISPSPLDVDDTLGALRYVAVFQLGDMAHQGEIKGEKRTILDTPVTEWDHNQTLEYINRNWSKLVPVLHRLLRTPQSTMADLLPLSVPQLSQLCATPTPQEEDSSHPTPDARAVAQARSWITTYKTKMDALAQRAHSMQVQAGKSGIAANTALNVLSGKDIMAGETGSVTRVDARGKVMRHSKLK